MGLRLDCDRCGRFIKNVSLKDIRSLPREEVVCVKCKQFEESAKSSIAAIRKTAQADFEKLCINYKDLVEKAVKELSKK